MAMQTSIERAALMSRISGKDTKPELILRKALHRLGFRYRLHDQTLPGRPDLVFKRFRAVIFVNGCFWHGHDCRHFNWPKSNAEFWHEKISKNRERDSRNVRLLRDLGWRVFTLWECAVRRAGPGAEEMVAVEVADWLESEESNGEMRGS